MISKYKVGDRVKVLATDMGDIGSALSDQLVHGEITAVRKTLYMGFDYSILPSEVWELSCGEKRRIDFEESSKSSFWAYESQIELRE